ncbi:hypothetical protein JJE66_34260 [Bradyrhizobium diazoefficiens]|uniref:hypothetical protein n=1 Tax=Bradyrhizobium diazoefficiens TaxID=1355477 RepID=UPI00190B878D|nr:hypothetical protein [Bradyrhizobium diazoefficiens]MBK3666269.1 hypothetical protein [Bradyrhizobium diazoefficiens]
MDHKNAPHFNIAPSYSLTRSGTRGIPKGPLGSSIASATGELAAIKDRLGFVDAYILQRDIGRESKRAIREAYGLLIEAQRQALVARMTHELDEEKKRIFVQSMQVSNAIDREIAELSAEFTGALFEGALSQGVAAARAEKETLQNLEELHQQGEITSIRYQQLQGAASEACDHITSIVKTNVAKIVESHLEKLEGTLRLFKDRALKEMP